MGEKIKIFEIGLDADEAVKVAGELQRKIALLAQENKNLNKTTVEGSKAFAKNKATMKELRQSYNQVEKQIIETNRQKKIESELRSRADKELNTEIKTKQEARNQNARLLQITKSLNTENGEQAEIFKELTARIDENTEYLKENGTAQEKLKYNIGNYKNDIKDALGELNPFNTSLEKNEDTFNKLSTGIKGAAKSLLTFMMTPIGMITALIAGIGMAVNEFLDYNNTIIDSIKLTQDITNTYGELSDEIRVKTQVISDAFDVDFKETLISARALVNEFGIDYNDALDLIADGLLTGGQANGEYLDSLKEFSVFFADAGFSAKEFNRIISEGADVGIYKDKLPDAIKEFKLSIEEATTASKDALNNAFGSEFTDSLLGNIESGAISVKDALFLVSEEAENVGLNSQQAQQLTADLFRGAGEDAGGALKIFKAVNNALKDEEKQYSALEIEIQKLYKANLELATAKDKALKSDAIIEMKYQFKSLWSEIKTGFYSILGKVLTRFGEFNDRVIALNVAVIKSMDEVKASFSGRLEDLKQGLVSLGKAGIDAFNIISQAANLDFTGAKESYALLKEDLSLGSEEIKNVFVNNNEKIKESFSKTYANVIEQRQLHREAMVELQKQYDEEDAVKKEEQEVVEEEERQRKKATIITYEKSITEAKGVEVDKQLQDVKTSITGQTEAEREHAKVVKQLEVQKTLSKNLANAQALGNVAQALGEESALGKGFALAQAGMNIQVGITKAVSSKGLAGFLEGLVIAAKGASIIGKISSTPTKFSEGGYLEGASHDNGGIPFTINGQSGFEAEGGEAIINKRSTALFKPLLSQINQVGGGVAFADGGIATPQPSTVDNGISLDATTIKVINVATETVEVANDVIKVENYANL